jgi:hypothetical protein
MVLTEESLAAPNVGPVMGVVKEFLSEMLNKTIKAYHDPTVDKSAALAALFHEFNQRYYRLLHNNERHITLEQSRHILEVTSAKTTE